mmetsp:Transcript_33138/g.69608  ORF Transcript_33138/g.69608 Transcript_33138/m.69608 type:complete len:194 (+) Transcript_33138:405-986(+)
MRVNGVAARQILRTLSRREHVLATHRTVVLVLVLHAAVGVVDAGGDAHAALDAVSEVFLSAYAAEAALVAVERAFVEGHPDVAFGAVVLGEGDSAFDAFIALAVLTSMTLLANHLPYRESIHRLPAIPPAHLVVTHPTSEDASAARCDDVAFSFVVYARYDFLLMVVVVDGGGIGIGSTDDVASSCCCSCYGG